MADTGESGRHTWCGRARAMHAHAAKLDMEVSVERVERVARRRPAGGDAGSALCG